MSAPVTQPEEQWRPVPGARVEVSNLGRVRDSAGGRIITPDASGRVPITTAHGRTRRTVRTMHAEIWLGAETQHQRRQRLHDGPDAPGKPHRVAAPTSPAWPPRWKQGPTDAATMLSVARAVVASERTCRPFRPHPGDSYDRRAPATAEDLDAWQREQPDRLRAWVDACAELEAGAAAAKAKRMAGDRIDAQVPRGARSVCNTVDKITVDESGDSR